MYRSYGSSYGYGRSSAGDNAMLIGIGLVAAIFLGGFVYGLSTIGSEMVKIIQYNISFWVVLIVSFGFGFYRKLTNPAKFTWGELPIMLFASFIVLVSLYGLFFTTTTDISDRELRSGYTTGAEYWEKWTERVPCRHTKYCTRYNSRTKSTESYACGTEHTYDEDYHPPYWVIRRKNVDDIHTSSDVYGNYVKLFGNQTFKHVWRPAQISIGDGNMYFTTWNGEKDRFVPAAMEYKFVNYLKASQSIKKRTGGDVLYGSYFRPYPRVYSTALGPIAVDRVVQAGTEMPASWVASLDKALDDELAYLGARKQVNILVYTVGSDDVGAGLAIEENWIKGKKNDVVVVLGMKKSGSPELGFPELKWAHIIAWTKVEEFKINLRNRLKEMKPADLADGEKVARVIVSEVDKPGKAGGFERMKMQELEYLISDITLPLWAQILIVLIIGGVNWLVSLWLIENEVV